MKKKILCINLLPIIEGATLEDLARDVPTGEVFQEPAAGVSQDVNRAVYALCQFAGEEPPRRFSLFGRLHPALLLHWRVQAHLVSRLSPDQRREYRELWAQEMVGGRQLSQYGMCQRLTDISAQGGLGLQKF